MIGTEEQQNLKIAELLGFSIEGETSIKEQGPIGMAIK
jgi:hypothetical protein